MSRLPRFDFTGRTALVTGAASGLGEHTAYRLAGEGSHLILLDRNADQLKAVAATIGRSQPGHAPETIVADLADPAQVRSAADQVLAAHAHLDLLVNNAGVALGGTFAETDLDELEWVLAVNLRAPIALTHHLLPALVAAPHSHLVTVSSIFGIVAPPLQTAYATSKFGVRGWSESLRGELAPLGIGVTTVHPGGIRTGIARHARIARRADQEQYARDTAAFDQLLTYPVDTAAGRVVEAVRRRKPRLLIGASARIPDVVARVAPAHYTDALLWLQRRYERQHAGEAAAEPDRASTALP